MSCSAPPPLRLRYTQRGSSGALAAFAVLVGLGVWHGRRVIDEDSVVPFIAVSGAIMIAVLYALLVHLLNRTTVTVEGGVLSVSTGPVPVFRGGLQQVQLSDRVDVELWLIERTIDKNVATAFSVTVEGATGPGVVLLFSDPVQARCAAHLLARAAADHVKA